MFFLYTLVACIAFMSVSEGRTVKGIVGRNVSWSWTFNHTKSDSISIFHNSSNLLQAWPLKNFVFWHVKDERLQVHVDNVTDVTLTVTVSISDISEPDAGQYNLASPWDSVDFIDSVFLQIIDEKMIPRIVQQNVLEATLVLECRVSRTSTGSFLWLLNGSLIGNDRRYFQNDTFLFITNLTLDDQYNLFQCRDSGGGLASDLYKIEISGPNTITFAPNTTMIQEYSGLSLPCLTDCYPICSWNWAKFDPSSGGENVISAEKALYFQNVTRQDAVKYSCRVQNQITGVSLENFTWLEIVYGPDKLLFNLSDKIIELDERDSVTISCYADCFPPCQIDWIGSNAETSMSSAELKLVNNTRDRNYTCRAMNPRKDNTKISDSIYVIVKSGTDNHNSTMETTPEGGKVFFDFHILVYIILGLGCILVAVGCILCLRKLRNMLTYRQTIEQNSIIRANEAIEIEYI